MTMGGALAGCGLFKKREHRAADCLDGMAEASSRWVQVARSLDAVKRQRGEAVEAQQRQADTIACVFGDQACSQRREAAQAAVRAAREQLERIDPSEARRVARRENPLEMVLVARSYEAPEGVAASELQAARGAVDTMWESCRLACRDLRCTGR